MTVLQMFCIPRSDVMRTSCLATFHLSNDSLPIRRQIHDHGYIADNSSEEKAQLNACDLRARLKAG